MRGYKTVLSLLLVQPTTQQLSGINTILLIQLQLIITLQGIAYHVAYLRTVCEYSMLHYLI